MKYPDEMPVLEKSDIHAGSVWKNSECPNCALGWFDYAFSEDQRRMKPYVFSPAWRHHSRLAKAYRKIAETLLGVSLVPSVGLINDERLSEGQRALVFNATCAALGYIVGQDPAAVKLARKAGFKV